jgi:outer membrane protein OmpA-like peptidoglycan-associated protein
MNRKFWQGMSIAAFAASCAHGPPPKELEEARATYQQVAAGPAAQVNSQGVADSKAALDRAEKSYQDNGDGYQTRDSAYVATRKAQLAEAQALTTLNAQQKAKLDKELLAAEQRENERLEAERRARADAEQKLAALGTVKHEGDRTALTLAGNIVFATGQYKLRTDARPKLDRVAEAIKEMHGKTIVVEGYTDSTGKDDTNQALSMKRATEVREYLIRQGIQPDQIRAVGYGKERPIAPNDTREGRAQNRRVEIIIQTNVS